MPDTPAPLDAAAGGRTPASSPADLVERAEEIVGSEAFRAASRYLADTDEQTLSEQVELTEIPAPPFGEAARGRRMSELMSVSGLTGVSTDAVGNVCGWLREPDARARPWVLSAHLDTVFPIDTDVSVTRQGSTLSGPGIADDGRGLAALLALTRAIRAAGIELVAPLLLAATVGEEGVGDLRGVRHLFSGEGLARSARAFISLDGAGLDRVVNEGVGSRRYRVTITGPGGHSWSDWGAPNPLHALGDVISSLGRIVLAEGATLSVGRAEGGRSVNAIPEEAWMECEVRSVSDAELTRLDSAVREAVEREVAAHGDTRPGSTQALGLQIEQIGHRPGGRTDPAHPLVEAALASTAALGQRAQLVASSTDANVPMAMGLPAITLGAGGTMGRAHTLHEWYDNAGGVAGMERALLTLMVFDALERE